MGLLSSLFGNNGFFSDNQAFRGATNRSYARLRKELGDGGTSAILAVALAYALYPNAQYKDNCEFDKILAMIKTYRRPPPTSVHLIEYWEAWLDEVKLSGIQTNEMFRTLWGQDIMAFIDGLMEAADEGNSSSQGKQLLKSISSSALGVVITRANEFARHAIAQGVENDDTIVIRNRTIAFAAGVNYVMLNQAWKGPLVAYEQAFRSVSLDSWIRFIGGFFVSAEVIDTEFVENSDTYIDLQCTLAGFVFELPDDYLESVKHARKVCDGTNQYEMRTTIVDSFFSMLRPSLPFADMHRVQSMHLFYFQMKAFKSSADEFFGRKDWHETCGGDID